VRSKAVEKRLGLEKRGIAGTSRGVLDLPMPLSIRGFGVFPQSELGELCCPYIEANGNMFGCTPGGRRVWLRGHGLAVRPRWDTTQGYMESHQPLPLVLSL
jgi:hypothetical protein